MIRLWSVLSKKYTYKFIPVFRELYFPGVSPRFLPISPTPRPKMATLRTTLSPKNATQKKLLWKSSKSSVASILGSSTGTSCKITTRKEGRATLTAKATDGSGRTAKITVKVTPHEGDLTPAPTPTPDPRIVTMVEDVKERGGSGYVVEKSRGVLDVWFGQNGE